MVSDYGLNFKVDNDIADCFTLLICYAPLSGKTTAIFMKRFDSICFNDLFDRIEAADTASNTPMLVPLIVLELEARIAADVTSDSDSKVRELNMATGEMLKPDSNLRNLDFFKPLTRNIHTLVKDILGKSSRRLQVLLEMVQVCRDYAKDLEPLATAANPRISQSTVELFERARKLTRDCILLSHQVTFNKATVELMNPMVRELRIASTQYR